VDNIYRLSLKTILLADISLLILLLTRLRHLKQEGSWVRSSFYEILPSLQLFLGCLRQAGAPSCLVLRALFEATGGTTWKEKSGWSSDSADLSAWYGVRVEGGRVIMTFKVREI
jgi:hypothetical protein